MARLSIGFKLGFVAMGLVAVCTASFAVLGYRTVSALYDGQAQRLRETRVRALERRSASVADDLGETARDALAGLETARLSRTLEGLVSHDSELHGAAIADDDGRLLVRTGETPAATLSGATSIEVNAAGVLEYERGAGAERERLVTYPIRSDSAVLGYLQLAWSLAELDADLAAIGRERDRQTASSVELLVGFSGLAVALGLLMAAVSSAVITRPVRRLVETARSLASGALDARSAVTSRDEIGELATTMNTMADRIGGLIDETRRHAEVAQELAIARDIQRMMIPSREPIRHPGFHVAGIVEAAQDCGGDFWAVAPLTRHRTLIVVADVTGHGLSSAMLTATARGCIDTVRQLTQGDLRVGSLLRIMDQLLREALGGGLTMTCLASIVDPIEATLTWANAGHPAPFLIRRAEGGTYRHGRLTSRGNRLGDADGYAFVEHSIAVKPGDLICWYTDGLLEAEDSDGSPFGSRRVRLALDGVADLAAQDIASTLVSAVRTHVGGAPLEDDVTVVVGRILRGA